MRIDSSGRVIVGKTSNSTSTAGTTLYSIGKIEGVRDGDVVHSFNRLSSDGTIVAFQKTALLRDIFPFVVQNFKLVKVMLLYNFLADAIVPANESGTAIDAIDLGISSGRFDDIRTTNDLQFKHQIKRKKYYSRQ